MVEVGERVHPLRLFSRGRLGGRRRSGDNVGVRGYDDTTYGEAMADVYDDWYADLDDVDAVVATLLDLAAGGPVLELGVGTGRIAAPLAAAAHAAGLDGCTVTGVDTSPAMLARIADKPGGDLVDARLGDMVDGMPVGPFALVVVAYNTFFALHGSARQAAAFRAVAGVLAPGGRFVLEAFVPSTDGPASEVAVRSIAADRVVLSVSRSDPSGQRAEGQFVELTESGGVRLRPWSIHWATPAQLDTMAEQAGLVLDQRWGAMDRSPFDDTSTRHVSVYRRAGDHSVAV